MKKIFFAFICFFAVAALKAQDKIYRQNGKIVSAKILEISSAEIKYKEADNPDGPIYILETDRIKKIVFADGKTQTFKEDTSDREKYTGELHKAVKINFFSPLYGYAEFGYEQTTGVGKSFEISLGILGLGKSESLSFYDGANTREVRRKPAGAFVSGGYKFNKLPDFILFGRTKMSHLMQGTYFKPVLYIGSYSENIITEKSNYDATVGKQHVTFGALQLELGKQRVFADKVVLDIYGGLGYGVDNKKQAYQYDYEYYDGGTTAFNYANTRIGNSPSISISFGIKVGLLIK